MAALGGLLGAYGSDEDDEQQHEEAQQTGQVTLLGEDSGGVGGFDLSHLTSGPATRLAEADTATGAAGAASALGGRPQSGQADQQQQQQAGAGPMDADAGPEGAAGGGEQPPAAADADADPMSLLPPEMRLLPDGECDPDVQARVANWLHIQRTRGKYINQDIRKSRGYRNPEFFAKMVEHLEIDQYGTSFAPEVFDPKALPKDDYLDALQKEWAAEEERRKAARAAGHGRVEFHKSASQPSLAQPVLKPGLSQPGAAASGQPAVGAARVGGLPGLPAGVQIQTAAQIQAAQAAAQAQVAAQAQAIAQAQAKAQAAAQAAGINAAAAVAAAQAQAARLAAQMTGMKPQR